MNRLLAAASLRYLLTHRTQCALTVLGIAVGVAAWVSVQTAARSAEFAFTVSAGQAFGEATHQLLPLEATLADAEYVSLQRTLGVERAAPVLEGRVRAVFEGDAVRLDVLGVDPLAETRMRPAIAGLLDDGPGATTLVGRRDAVVIGDALAAAHGLDVGDALGVERPDGVRELEIVAVVDTGTLPGGAHTVLMDIAGAQWLTGQAGRLSRVDLILEDDDARAVADWLPDTLELVGTAARSEAVLDMTRAYRLNLQALSLLTLLVGLLLVYSTLSHLVVQRGRVFDRLHALGVSRDRLRRLVLGEAAVLGLVGGLLGAAAGLLLAGWLVGLVTANITDLYFSVEVAAIRPEPGVALAGVALGVAASLAGAWLPAGEAAYGRVARAMTRALPATVVACALAAAGALLLVTTSAALVPAFAGLFLVALAGTALLVPVVAGVCGAAARLVRRHLLAAMTIREVRAGLHRTGIALAGLVLAVATVVSIDTMVDSFRGSVAQWLDGAVDGDLVISVDRDIWSEVAQAPLPELRERLLDSPEVSGVRATRFLRLREGATTTLLRAGEYGPAPDGVVRGAAGDAFAEGRGVLVSEPLAQRRALAPGDPLRLAFAEGAAELPVLGVFRDYLSERGVVLIALDAYRDLTGDAAISTLAVDAASSTRALRDAVDALIEDTDGLQVTVSEDIRDRTLEIFDRTFTVTRVLKFLAAGVAFLGVFGSFLALLLERRPLRRTLRATGLDERTLGWLAVLESAVLGVVTAIVALPLGVVLSALLVRVINVRSFGWSMDFAIQPVALLQGAALAVLTAVAAGVAATLLFRDEDAADAQRGRARRSGRRLPAGASALLLVIVLTVMAAGCGRDGAPPPDDPLRAADLLVDDDAPEGFARVTGPRDLEFPADHGAHPEYRLEWWYLTGDMRAEASGERFGFQYTLFRFALAPPDGDTNAGGWDDRQMYMAHIALTRVATGEHRHAERVTRAGPGLAGAQADPFEAWLHDWRLWSLEPPDLLPISLAARSRDAGIALALEFAPGRGPVLHGERGYSRKGRDPGNASHYYSYTRLPTRGTLRWDDVDVDVDGIAWMDREWSTSALDDGVVGWDWLSLRLADGRDLMLGRLRERDGGDSRWSIATLVSADGEARALDAGEWTLAPLAHWTSPATGSRYPVRWRVEVPAERIALTVDAVVEAQELDATVRYWEGLVDAYDETGEQVGSGYVELTGY